MTTEAEVFAEIQRIAREELDHTRPVSLTDSLAQDLELDSMGLIIVAVNLENRFRIKLSEQDAERIDTVQDVVRWVVRRTEESPS